MSPEIHDPTGVKVFAGPDTIIALMDGETGAEVWQTNPGTGIHDLTPYGQFMMEGEFIVITGGRVVEKGRPLPGSRLAVQRPFAPDTGANPDFVPSSADTQRRQMQVMMRNVADKALKKQLDKQQSDLAILRTRLDEQEAKAAQEGVVDDDDTEVVDDDTETPEETQE